MSANKVVICGTGEVAELSFFYFSKIANFKVVGFCQEKEFISEQSFCGLPVFEIDEIREKFDRNRISFFVAVGFKGLNKVRETLFLKLKGLGLRPASFIHPRAHLYDSVQLGEHLFILENVVIQPFVKIRDNCFIWSSAVICHHCRIEENVFIASGVSIGGGSYIGRNVFIGMNATVKDHIKIGQGTLIGAGTVVNCNLKECSVLAPAKVRFFDTGDRGRWKSKKLL